MNEDFIVLLHDENCTVWKVPELSEDVRSRPQSMLPGPMARMEPLQVLEYGGGVLGLPDPLCCNGLYDWYTDSPQPLWFDVVEERGTTLNFSRFEVACNTHTPLRLSIEPISTFQVDAPDGRTIAPYRVCGECLVVTWCSSGGIHCHTEHTTKTDAIQDHKIGRAHV